MLRKKVRGKVTYPNPEDNANGNDSDSLAQQPKSPLPEDDSTVLSQSHATTSAVDQRLDLEKLSIAEDGFKVLPARSKAVEYGLE